MSMSRYVVPCIIVSLRWISVLNTVPSVLYMKYECLCRTLCRVRTLFFVYINIYGFIEEISFNGWTKNAIEQDYAFFVQELTFTVVGPGKCGIRALHVHYFTF